MCHMEKLTPRNISPNIFFRIHLVRVVVTLKAAPTDGNLYGAWHKARPYLRSTCRTAMQCAPSFATMQNITQHNFCPAVHNFSKIGVHANLSIQEHFFQWLWHILVECSGRDQRQTARESAVPVTLARLCSLHCRRTHRHSLATKFSRVVVTTPSPSRYVTFRGT